MMPHINFTEQKIKTKCLQNTDKKATPILKAHYFTFKLSGSKISIRNIRNLYVILITLSYNVNQQGSPTLNHARNLI